MQISILTQYYPPEIGAPQARLSRLSSQLVRRGHRVHILTALPSYPHGRIAAGYHQLLRRETLDGADVTHCPIYPSQAARMVPRLTNYLSFVASSSFFGSFTLPRSDYLLVESPPLFLGLTGYWLSRLKSARLIFNVSDLWPESAVRVGAIRRQSRAFSMASRLEEFCYRKAWLVTGQSRGIVAHIAERFPEVPTFHLSNGADTEMFSPSKQANSAQALLGNHGSFTAVYAGLHGLAQGLSQVVAAAGLLNGRSDIRCIFIGDGPERESLIRSSSGLPNVCFLPPQRAGAIPAFLASADALLVVLKDDIPGAVPSKLYEAMASGRPVIFVGHGEGAEILRNASAGIVVEPGDTTGLTSALERLRSQPQLCRELGQNGRKAAVERFDQRQINDRFIRYLEEHIAEEHSHLLKGSLC